MMGRQTTPERLFYDFCLEDHVPVGHLLRQIDSVLDLDELRDQLKPFYSPIGRPSVDPELMVRMLLVGYCFGIRCVARRACTARNCGRTLSRAAGLARRCETARPL